MADKPNKRSLVREAEPSQKSEASQKTEKGLEISVSKPLIKLAFHER